jgi:hypothetical protein
MGMHLKPPCSFLQIERPDSLLPLYHTAACLEVLKMGDFSDSFRLVNRASED